MHSYPLYSNQPPHLGTLTDVKRTRQILCVVRDLPQSVYSGQMGLFSRRRRPDPGTSSARSRHETFTYLYNFVTTRIGVEAYVEPQTQVTPTTVMLVATDGEWTRRRVPDAKSAWDLAKDLGIPCYDVQRVGYPQRVRDYNARKRIERRRSS